MTDNDSLHPLCPVYGKPFTWFVGYVPQDTFKTRFYCNSRKRAIQTGNIMLDGKAKAAEI